MVLSDNLNQFYNAPLVFSNNACHNHPNSKGDKAGDFYVSFEWNTALLIHVGALLYIIAFLIRDELKLRLMVLAGSAFYLLYYYFYPQVPLWDAITTTTILVLANIIILFRILLERTMFGLSAEAKALFADFEGFSPGQFRQLLKIARWCRASSPTILTSEGEPLSKLYFLIRGRALVQKGSQHFPLESGNFVGEIAFVLKGLPSATVTAENGASYIEWQQEDIWALMIKSPAFQNATMALLSRDLADKLSNSVQTGLEETLVP